jgi:Ran GTPase-activating protein (RanGAP) involved in mRNA processing and transport
LTNLAITDNNLEEAQLQNVVKLIEFLKSLKFLDLSGNNLRVSGVKILAESLKSNKTLLSLYLNKNNIESNGGFYLADSLIKNETLEKLSLASNRINDNGLSSLLTVLSNNNKTIKYLDLSDNQLKNPDLQNISEFISQSPSLNILNISKNSIDAISSHLIGLSLRAAQKLSIVYLQSTNLNEESAPLLLKNLSDSKICEIYLDDNPFGEIGAILLANTIKSNNEIRFVSLRKCNLSSMALSCLCKVLESNSGLEGINLEENSFDEQSVLMIENVMKKKNNPNLKVYLSVTYLTAKAKDILKNNSSFILY